MSERTALDTLVDHALRVRPALATHRNRADLAALLGVFLERLERDGQVQEKERSCDG